MFARSGSTWSQQQELTAAYHGHEQFGFAVALSADGSTALIGAPYNKVGMNKHQGAAYVFGS